MYDPYVPDALDRRSLVCYAIIDCSPQLSVAQAESPWLQLLADGPTDASRRGYKLIRDPSSSPLEG
jgi:hypothetical protein